MQLTDAQLIEEHRRGSRDAFAQLVRRHVDWVWSCARRRLHDEHLAQDATQAAFEVLARKAPRLREGEALSLWLHGVVVLTCKQLMRSDLRRKRRETEAAKMRGKFDMTEDNRWDEVAPHLDEVVGRLNREDRQAVLLRFFEKKNFAEIGAVLGVSEEAARKRVSRATDKLREMLTAKGVSVPATVLTATLLTETTQSAPAALASQITIGAASSGGALAKGVIAIMIISKAKIAAATVLAAVLLVGGGVAVKTWMSQETPLVVSASRRSTSPSPTTHESGIAEFEKRYRLEDGQALKYVPPPFIEGRIDFVFADAISKGAPRPDSFAGQSLWFRWDGKPHLMAAVMDGIPTFDTIMRLSVHLKPYEFQVPPELLDMRLEGDWVFRDGATEEQKIEAISKIMTTHLGRKISFERRAVDQEVMVVTGNYALKPLENFNDNAVHVFVDNTDKTADDVTTGRLDQFLETLGEMMQRRLVVQVEGNPQQRLRYCIHESARRTLSASSSPQREAELRGLFHTIAAQTGLNFTRTIQTWDVWHVVEP